MRGLKENSGRVRELQGWSLEAQRWRAGSRFSILGEQCLHRGRAWPEEGLDGCQLLVLGMASFPPPIIQIDPANAALVSEAADTVDSIDVEARPLGKVRRVARPGRPVARVLVMLDEALGQLRCLVIILDRENLDVAIERQALLARHAAPPRGPLGVPRGAVARLVEAGVRHGGVRIRRDAQRRILALARQCISPVLRSAPLIGMSVTQVRSKRRRRREVDWPWHLHGQSKHEQVSVVIAGRKVLCTTTDHPPQPRSLVVVVVRA